MIPSGNLNPERRYPSLFEPVHGSAHDIMGKGIANPIAMVWAGALMSDFLGESESAQMILMGIENVVKRHTTLTPDLDGIATTAEVGQNICEAISTL